MNFKISTIVLLLLFSSCTTIYKIQYQKSEYILKKGNSFETFDFKGKDTFSLEYINYINEHGREELPVMNLTTNFEAVVTENFIVYRNFDKFDTLFLKKEAIQNKTNLIQGFYLDELFVCSNGTILKSEHGRNFVAKYKTDSIHHFNNQPSVKTFVFDYYIVNKKSSLNNLINPITISISSFDGMPLSISYNMCLPNTEEFRASNFVEDYRTVFCRKKRLKRFLM